MLGNKHYDLVLVDGSSYLFRAFFAMPNLMNSKQAPTGAVYGVTNMIRRLLREYQPRYLAVVFDAKGKTFRNEIYAEYKAQRPPMPDDLRSQIAPIHDIIRAMGLPLIVIEGVEADDVIATLARAACARKLTTLISTGDKDLAQLVNERISLINTMNDQLLDPQGVVDKFGVLPTQIIDYLTLIGDTSDNIPGVPKVGPKTAVKWLKEHETLDEIVKHADKVKGKVGEYLRDTLDFLPTSRALITLKDDVEIAESLDDLQPKKPNVAQLKTLFEALEFKTWRKELEKENEVVATVPTVEPLAEVQKAEVEIIFTEAALHKWLDRIREKGLMVFDTETTSLNYMQAKLVGVSFAVDGDHAAYVPFGHDYLGVPDQLSKAFVLSALKPILEDESIAKLGQNLKYDMSVLAAAGITLRNIQFDTMLESYVLDSTASRHNLDDLAEKHLQRTTIHFTDIAGKGKKQLTFNQIDIEIAGPYAAEDVEICWKLHQTFWQQLKQLPSLHNLFEKIEMPLVPVLSRIERNGVLVNADQLNVLSGELGQRIQEIEVQCHALVGHEFNLASPKQLQKILFEDLGLPVKKKTPKGQPSTAEGVLEELAQDYPLPKLIMEHRGLSKLKSTYADKLPKMIDPDTGRIHTSYHQAVTATGRLSSSDPNLQNIPIRNADGRRIRQAFMAPEGCKIMAADYSQVELRIMAHLSGDEALMTAFSEGIDIHRATAAEVFSVQAEEVSTEQRRHAKAINFGLIYGMSAFGLARELNIDRVTAKNYIDVYFDRYPGVKAFMDLTRAKAHEDGYVETVFGRRLYLPEIHSKNNQRRQYAERTAINAPMQGTAADMIKVAMIEIDQWLENHRSEYPEIKMIMQVHDELVFEVPAAQIEMFTPIVREKMVQAADLAVPLVVDIGIGDHWDEAH